MDIDDKDLVIIAVFFICIGAMAIPNVSDPAFEMIKQALAGLFGIAVGRATK